MRSQFEYLRICEYAKYAKSVFEAILKSLENDRIDLDNCHSQCYDNAAVMSGHISGVQKLIIDKNLKFIFTYCDNHSLTLCGVHASHEERELATFFSSLDIVLALNYTMGNFKKEVEMSCETKK